MKFEQHWPGLQRRTHLLFSIFFLYKYMGPLQMPREANLTLPYKVKSHCTSIILKTLVDFCAKIQPQGILGSGEEV